VSWELRRSPDPLYLFERKERKREKREEREGENEGDRKGRSRGRGGFCTQRKKVGVRRL